MVAVLQGHVDPIHLLTYPLLPPPVPPSGGWEREHGGAGRRGGDVGWMGMGGGWKGGVAKGGERGREKEGERGEEVGDVSATHGCPDRQRWQTIITGAGVVLPTVL